MDQAAVERILRTVSPPLTASDIQELSAKISKISQAELSAALKKSETPRIVKPPYPKRRKSQSPR